MAKSTWTYLKGEKRVGEYEELSVKSVGHWGIMFDEEWPEELRKNYHLFSETGVGMIEPTKLKIKNYNSYRDPYKLTYRSYTLQQDVEEKMLDSIIEGAKARDSFCNSPVLEEITQKYIPAMRHYFWGTGMIQIYGSAYTHSGTVMNSLLFQVFDSMRHAQRSVEISWELNHAKGIEVDSLDTWLNWKEMQPLRKFIEIALTNFDWGENFILINFVLDPIFQPLHTAIMVNIPESKGDWAIPQFWLKLLKDINRHVVCGEEFVKAMIKEDEGNLQIIQEWVNKWYGMAVDSIDGLAPLIERAGQQGFNKDFNSMKTEILDNYSKKLNVFGLTVPKGW